MAIVKRTPPEVARNRQGFSLVELLFAIFILGIGMAMSAALFPTAMRQNENSFKDTTGTLVCKNALAIARMSLTEADFPDDDPNLRILADEHPDHSDPNNYPDCLLYLTAQHYPFGIDDANVPTDRRLRGSVLLGRRIDTDDDPNSKEGYQLIAISYAREPDRKHPDDPNPKVIALSVTGDIVYDEDEYVSTFVMKNKPDVPLSMASPLIIQRKDPDTGEVEEVEFLTILKVIHDGTDRIAVLDRDDLAEADDVEGFVVVEWNDRNNNGKTDFDTDISPLSPALETMMSRTGLRRQ